MMGSSIGEAGRSSDEMQHKVALSWGFYLGNYEVTQEQWESVMNTRPWLDKTRSQLDEITLRGNECHFQPQLSRCVSFVARRTGFCRSFKSANYLLSYGFRYSYHGGLGFRLSRGK